MEFCLPKRKRKKKKRLLKSVGIIKFCKNINVMTIRNQSNSEFNSNDNDDNVLLFIFYYTNQYLKRSIYFDVFLFVDKIKL